MTALEAVVVRAEHAPHIIAGTARAASLGKPDLTCPTCRGESARGFHWFDGERERVDDVVLIADSTAWGTLHDVRRLPVVNGTTTRPDADHIAVYERALLHVRWDGEAFTPSPLDEALPCGPWGEGDTAITWASFTPTITVDCSPMRGYVVIPCPVALPGAPTALGLTTIDAGGL